jgi:hypothetical protein
MRALTSAREEHKNVEVKTDEQLHDRGGNGSAAAAKPGAEKSSADDERDADAVHARA